MNSKKNKTKQVRLSEAEVERNTVIILRRLDVFESLAKRVIVGVVIVLAIYFGVYKPIEVSVGQETTIHYLLDFVADVKLHVWMAWGVAATASAVAWRERKLRMRERKEKDPRIAALESKLDEGRTSSNMNVSGTQEITKTGGTRS